MKKSDVLVQLAVEAFSSHQLIDNKYDRWFIARPDCGWHAAEIILLRNGRLFVGGDIDDCVFAYYSGPQDPIHRLQWIGHSNLDYVCEKARIGMTDGGKLTMRHGKPSARTVYAWAAVRKLCELLGS